MKRVLIIAILALFIACSAQQDLMENKQRSFRFTGTQYQSDIALVIPPEIRNIQYEYSSGNMLIKVGGYKVEFGDGLTDMLVSMTDFVYGDVEVLTEMPRAGQFERVIMVTKKAAGIGTSFVKGTTDVEQRRFSEFSSSTPSSADVVFHLAVNVESFNGTNLSSMKKRVIENNGKFRANVQSQQINMSHGNNKLKSTIGDVISKTGEKLANLLGGGFAEVPSTR